MSLRAGAIAVAAEVFKRALWNCDDGDEEGTPWDQYAVETIDALWDYLEGRAEEWNERVNMWEPDAEDFIAVLRRNS